MCMYLHGVSLGESDLKVLPLPPLLHDVGEDDLAVPTGSSELSPISGPGQTEHTARVRLL